MIRQFIQLRRAVVYDPDSGRFFSEDPIGFDSGDYRVIYSEDKGIKEIFVLSVTPHKYEEIKR